MNGVDDLPTHYFDVRWACPRCGRFIAQAAVRSWDVLDPGEYYGVRGVIAADCGGCGEIEPVCRPVKEIPWVAPPEPSAVESAGGDGSAWMESTSVTARSDLTNHGPTLHDLLSRSSLGCPREPISCGHMLVDHAGDGWDENGDPIYAACRVPGCDCDGVS